MLYEASRWHSQRRRIELHYSDSMMKYLMSGTVLPPVIDHRLALELFFDDSRDKQERRPPTPDIPCRYWHLSNPGDLEEIRTTAAADVIDTHQIFSSLSRLAIIAYAQDNEGAEAKTQENVPVEYLFHQVNITLRRWQADLTDWRSTTTLDLHKHAKLTSLLTKQSTSAAFLPEFKLLPDHHKTKVIHILNTELWGFLSKFIGSGKYRYLLNQTTDNDGLNLLQKLNHGRVTPSVHAGASILNRLTEMMQKPGHPWEQYRSHISELEDDYIEATGNNFPTDLVRLALTDRTRLQSFYGPVITILETRTALGQADLPYDAPGKEISITSLMESHQQNNQKDYNNYLAKQGRRNKALRKPHRNASANMAEAKGNNSNRFNKSNRRSNANRNRDATPKSFNCTWCKKHRPDKPTTHREHDCRIKADHQNTVCDICNARGHPAKFCPNSKGRAHNCEETKQSPNNFPVSGPQYQPLTKHGLAPEDELCAAEAQRAIKNAHEQLKTRGVKGARFKVIYLDGRERHS